MPEHVRHTEASFGHVEVVFVYSTLGWVFVRRAVAQAMDNISTLVLSHRTNCVCKVYNDLWVFSFIFCEIQGTIQNIIRHEMIALKNKIESRIKSHIKY